MIYSMDLLVPALIARILRFMTDRDPDTSFGIKILTVFLVIKKLQMISRFQEWTLNTFVGAQST